MRHPQNSPMSVRTICATVSAIEWQSRFLCTDWHKSWDMTHWIRPNSIFKGQSTIYNKQLRPLRGHKRRWERVSMSKNEDWIRPGHGKVIALLHGIGAKDPQDYWSAFLEVLSNDETLQEFGLFVWKYPTHVNPSWWRNLNAFIKTRRFSET